MNYQEIITLAYKMLGENIWERLGVDIQHDIEPQYLQSYLNEFCYKYNRRYFEEKLFDRLLIACVSYKNEF